MIRRRPPVDREVVLAILVAVFAVAVLVLVAVASAYIRT